MEEPKQSPNKTQDKLAEKMELFQVILNNYLFHNNVNELSEADLGRALNKLIYLDEDFSENIYTVALGDNFMTSDEFICDNKNSQKDLKRLNHFSKVDFINIESIGSFEVYFYKETQEKEFLKNVIEEIIAKFNIELRNATG